MVYLIILLSVCTHQVEGILNKKCSEKVNSNGFILTGLISLFSMLFFVFTDKNGFGFDVGLIPYAVIGGILYCLAVLFTYLALGSGSYTMTNLILSYSLLFTIAYGCLFRNEKPNFFVYLGIAVMLVSFYFNRGENIAAKKKLSLKWVIFAALSFFSSGMIGVVAKMQQFKFCEPKTNTPLYGNEFMIIALGISAAVLITAGIVTNGKNVGTEIKKCAPYAIFAGLANGVTNALGFIIAAMMPLSISTPLTAGVKIIISFIVSRIIFKESFIKRQIFGVALGTVGIVLLNLK